MKAIRQITLKNACLEARVLTYGATLQDLRFHGLPVVAGSDRAEDYLGPLRYFGAIVGRVANRIAAARFEMGTKAYAVDANENGVTCLHGGAEGSGTRVWNVLEQGRVSVVLGLRLEEGHMGFPGALDVRARYELSGGALRLEISAKSTADTPCSFAPHGFWNLGGTGRIDDHTLRVAAEHYLPVTDAMIPTGDVAEVAGTPFDFRQASRIGDRPLDHNLCLSAERKGLRPVLWLHKGDLRLEVATTETGVQIYDGRHAGRRGLAIEPQVWPDAINQTGFPDVVLKAGETYQAVTEFRLSKG